MNDQPGRRMLLVHAHPDDETLGNGATMAKYAAEGAQVTLLTCTRGEEGLVLVPELEQLAAHRDDRLGAHRETELAAAMAALGVRDHRFLDTVALPADQGRIRYRDSGMVWDADHRAVAAPDTGPDAFARVEVDAAAARVAAVIREVRPQVVITYNENGGYGHPDHIQAHRVAVAAFDAAGDPGRYPGTGDPWRPSKLYYTAFPVSFLRMGYDALKAMGEEAPFGVTSPEELTFGDPDETITTEIDARDHLEAKLDAMRAHATQIEVDGPFFALSNHIGHRAFGMEFYRLVRGTPPTAGTRETDLFEAV